MITYVFLMLALMGGDRYAIDLLEHERDHCRRWGIAEDKWVYNFTPDAQMICRNKTGYVFIDACAELWSDGTCRIWINRD